MIPYNDYPNTVIELDTSSIASFLRTEDDNLDKRTVKSFGDEWASYPSFEEKEIKAIGDKYFDLVDNKIINKGSICLDVGCGSGRWMKYLHNHVGFIEGIDPSSAALIASKQLSGTANTRITQASVSNIPFEPGSFDFVYSLGVLHHIPSVFDGIRRCYDSLKPSCWFLVYLYYNLDNRNWFFKILFRMSNLMRLVISSLPQKPKKIVCDSIAYMVYFPLSRLALGLSKIDKTGKFYKMIPLSFYKDYSLYIMRNDALDRFGTPLEKRFSKEEIKKLLQKAGFINIKFSKNEPYWHAIGQKPG